jgi:hypothetical protein
MTPSTTTTSLSLLGVDDDLNTNKRFEERPARQEARIYELEQLQLLSFDKALTPNQAAEFEGLQEKVFVEHYDPSSFSPSHAAFKAQHNTIFRQLCLYCGCGSEHSKNIFFLDGPDASTSAALLQPHKGGKVILISPDSCYVANQHVSSCEALIQPSGFPAHHISHSSAHTALSSSDNVDPNGGGDFDGIPFGAYYLDGCGGHVPIIQQMLETIRTNPAPPPIAVGFSLVGNRKDFCQNELLLVQSLVKIARSKQLRVEHVLDDWERYETTTLAGLDTTDNATTAATDDNNNHSGESPASGVIAKVDGNILTTWFLLVKDDR